MSQCVKTIGLLILIHIIPSCQRDTDKPPPFRHQALYERLQDHALDFTFIEGDWLEDFGDASFYGPAFYVNAGLTEENQDYLDMAHAAHLRNMEVIREADLLNGDVNEIIMAALGAIDYMAASGDRSGLADLNVLLDNLDELVQLLGGYLDANLVPGYAMDTYGPTSINGLLGLIYLQHALLLNDENRERFIQWGADMAERIVLEAWNGESYDFGSARSGLFLYPNVTMVLLNARLFQLTKDPGDLNNALAAHHAMQDLLVTEEMGQIGVGRYYSPYSAEFMGAQTENYTTLSSQNFVIFSLCLLYKITGLNVFLEEIDPILDFLEDYLEGEWCLSHIHQQECAEPCTTDSVCVAEVCVAESCHQGILHHWMDGRLAEPQDPEFFCSGCNLQLLYSLWYRQEML